MAKPPKLFYFINFEYESENHINQKCRQSRYAELEQSRRRAVAAETRHRTVYIKRKSRACRAANQHLCEVNRKMRRYDVLLSLVNHNQKNRRHCQRADRACESQTADFKTAQTYKYESRHEIHHDTED